MGEEEKGAESYEGVEMSTVEGVSDEGFKNGKRTGREDLQ